VISPLPHRGNGKSIPSVFALLVASLIPLSIATTYFHQFYLSDLKIKYISHCYSILNMIMLDKIYCTDEQIERANKALRLNGGSDYDYDPKLLK
jgi:hypothetical protein